MSRWRTRTTTSRGSAARVIRGIGAVFALIEVLHILMVLLGANQSNALFGLIRSLAEPLALFFPGLFPLGDPNLALIVNYGLAAVFWLVVSGFVARAVSR